MKNVLKISVLAVALFVSAQSHAQSKVHKVEHQIGDDAKAVGHKTSEMASKGESSVVDRKYHGKYGPNHETVFVDHHSRYYYVNKRGHRIYLRRSELRDR